MEKELNLKILEELKQQGYSYFLGNTTDRADETLISLTPIKYNPEELALPAGFDSWYDFAENAVEMAGGVDGIKFIVLNNSI